MLDQSFSSKNLQKVFSYSDFLKFEIGNDKAEIKELMEVISQKITSPNFKFIPLQEKMVDNNLVFSVSTIEEEFALRKLNDNIKRLYKVKQADRFLIVNQIFTLLKESTPFSVIKLDIEKYYENIDKEKIIKKLINDSLLSFASRELLKEFFLIPQLKKNEKGLPRGINISATLSEIYMRDFDSRMRQLDGIYFYARYVDDIILFSFNNYSDIIKNVEQLLNKETGLCFNTDKTKELNRVICRCKIDCICSTPSCRCKDKCICIKDRQIKTFDYLGYQFSFFDISNVKESKIEVSLADKKVKKIKTRIVKSFLEYFRNRDYELLNSRIRFLTSNYKLKRNANERGLKAGIYYNYPHLTSVEKLEHLTIFLRRIVNSRNLNFGNKIRTYTSQNQRDELNKFCFKYGYENRILKRYSASDIRKIKRCW